MSQVGSRIGSAPFCRRNCTDARDSSGKASPSRDSLIVCDACRRERGTAGAQSDCSRTGCKRVLGCRPTSAGQWTADLIAMREREGEASALTCKREKRIEKKRKRWKQASGCTALCRETMTRTHARTVDSRCGDRSRGARGEGKVAHVDSRCCPAPVTVSEERDSQDNGRSSHAPGINGHK